MVPLFIDEHCAAHYKCRHLGKLWYNSSKATVPSDTHCVSDLYRLILKIDTSISHRYRTTSFSTSFPPFFWKLIYGTGTKTTLHIFYCKYQLKIVLELLLQIIEKFLMLVSRDLHFLSGVQNTRFKTNKILQIKKKWLLNYGSTYFNDSEQHTIAQWPCLCYEVVTCQKIAFLFRERNFTLFL